MNQLTPGFCYTPTGLQLVDQLPARNAGLATLTRATTDHEALGSWLIRYLESPNTLSSYRREGERLLLWLQARQQTLQQLTVEDLVEYRQWLRDPLPRERWCLQIEPRHLEDGSPNPAWKYVRTVSRNLADGSPNPAWRPFVSGLSASAAKQAETILFGLFEYLASVGYLRANPWRAIRRRQPQVRREVERYLPEDLWQWLLSYIERMPRDTKRAEAHYQRTRFLLQFMFLTGLRISEIADARTSHLLHKRGQWWLRVRGKGKESDIPLPGDALRCVERYRTALKRSPWPHPDFVEPLVMDISGKGRALTTNALHQIVTDFFEGAAQAASPEHATILRQASMHWLRHTCATSMIEAGIPLMVVRDQLRHASVQTTEANYVHSNRDKQHQEAQRHQLIRRET